MFPAFNELGNGFCGVLPPHYRNRVQKAVHGFAQCVSVQLGSGVAQLTNGCPQRQTLPGVFVVVLQPFQRAYGVTGVSATQQRRL
jgi:hypothetical protein